MSRHPHCFFCGSEIHTATVCPDNTIDAKLTIREWLSVYMVRRFGTVRSAANYYCVSNSAISMALAGLRPLPPRLLSDAGVSFGMQISEAKP